MPENYSIDDELDRYDRALSLRSANIPDSKSTADVVRYNKARKVDEVFMKMKGGGHVKIAERDVDPITELQRYDTTLRDAGQTPSVDDYYAAGFDDDQINQAGLMPQARQPGRTEPLSDYEKLYVERQGGELLQAGPSQPLFDNALSEVTKGLVRGGLVRPSQFLKDNFNIYDPLVLQIVDPQTGEFDPQIKLLSREEKAALDQKMAAGEMPYAIDFEQLVSADEASGAGAKVMGDISQFVGAFAGLGKLFKIGSGFAGAATQGAAADFLAYKGDEGRITDLLLQLGVPENRVTDFLKTDPNDPDYVGRFKTALEGGPIGVMMDAGLLAIGKTFRAIKDGDVLPEAVKTAVAEGKDALGRAFLKQVEAANERIAQEGNTLFSNPVGPIVDRGLAVAGKLAGDAPSATTPNQAGSAIKLYHGTDAPEFKQFDPSQARTAKHIYTSPIRDDAAAYGKNVLEFETNANILDLRADTRGVNETKVLRQAYNDGGLDDYFESFDDFLDAFDNGDMYQRFGSQNAQNAVIDELFAASGADGLRIPDAGFGGSLSESIVFKDPSKLQRVTQEPAKPSAAELRRQANIQRFGYDPNEAPADTSYRMQHQPTGPEGGEGIRLDDLTKNISGEQAGYPEDFYSPKGQRVYAQGPSFKDDEYGLANQESYKVIKSVRGNPDAEVTMYRAVPDEDTITTINPGDFVTLSPTYAKLHAASGYGRSGNEAGKVLEQKVKVRDIYWDGNDVNEFGYFPEEQ